MRKTFLAIVKPLPLGVRVAMKHNHWLEKIQAKRKQGDKDSAERIVKSGDEFRRRGRGGPVPPSATLLVSGRGLLPSLVGRVEVESLAMKTIFAILGVVVFILLISLVWREHVHWGLSHTGEKRAQWHHLSRLLARAGADAYGCSGWP